ncbi:MAG: hypothetical protein EOP48_25275 [Sphingobacteriales bacterium]|nr:MAG: hypothetical protein EOP48_25275 [Sphingobacteriales bacterium]
MKFKWILFPALCIVLLIACKPTKTPFTLNTKVNYIPYYLEMYRADSLFLANNFDGSYKKLDSLFKIYKPLDTENYAEYGIYLSSAVRSGHLDGIRDKAVYGYKHFGNIVTIHKEAPEMHDAVNRAAGLNEEDIRKLKEEYSARLNMPLREKMLQMFKEDQEVRNGGTVQERNAVDERNRIVLEELITTYGYPRKHLTGSYSAWELPGGNIREDIFFLHQPNDFKLRYLPVILENVKAGICSPTVYAVVYDRMMLKNNDAQYYGSYDCDSTCALLNPKKIDSIRASIGLPHIKYYPWRMMRVEE